MLPFLFLIAHSYFAAGQVLPINVGATFAYVLTSEGDYSGLIECTSVKELDRGIVFYVFSDARGDKRFRIQNNVWNRKDVNEDTDDIRLNLHDYQLSTGGSRWTPPNNWMSLRPAESNPGNVMDRKIRTALLKQVCPIFAFL